MMSLIQILKSENIVIKEMTDFRKMILPLFSLTHGEKYETGDVTTYDCFVREMISVRC